MDRPIPTQIRAARAMLNRSMLDLAGAARVSVAVVQRFESGGRHPVLEDIVARMQDVLETEGVRFLADDGNGPGARFGGVAKAIAPASVERRGSGMRGHRLAD